MPIAKDHVVSMNYTLKNDKGEIIDQSKGDPLVYLHGHKNIVPGLEKELSGLSVGDSKSVKVSPKEGYGEYQDGLKFPMPKAQLGDDIPPLGSLVQLQNEKEQVFVARIVEITDEQLLLDANHPLAGENLNFEIEITDVRAAQPEEIAHGHVHGPGGHHH